MSGHDLAEARVVRAILAVLGIAALIYGGLSLVAVVDQATHYVSPVWTLIAAPVLFLVPPVLAVVSRFLTLRTLRLALGAYTVAFLIAVGTWLPAMHSAAMPLDSPPWPLAITSLGTVPAALAWRPVSAWAALAGNAALLVIVRYAATGGENLSEALQDGVFAIAFSSIFTVVAIVAIRNARALDAAAAVARGIAASAASTAARAHERARLDALIHDELMTALYYATADRGELTGSVRSQAQRALAELARLDASRDDEAPVEPHALASRLRAVLLELSSGLTIATDVRRTEPLPVSIADAFAEGAAEALRNSLRHAGGPEVRRSAVIRITARGATVIVRDEGKGFDPAAVDPYRLGLVVSIRGRLSAVPHGSAHVATAPGRGTTVTLDWRDA